MEPRWSPSCNRRFAEGYGQNSVSGNHDKIDDEFLLQLWEADTGRRVAAAKENIGGGVESLDFSGDGSWIVSTNGDGTCRLWNPLTLSPLQTIAERLHPTTALAAFSPDSARLLVVRTGAALATIYRRR